MLAPLSHLPETEIARRLAQRPRLLASAQPEYPLLAQMLPGTPKPASVLIPFVRINGGRQAPAWHLLLTRRNANLPEHSGQVAFPGGRSDPEDHTPEETALREAQEEIGVQPADVHILGRLDEFLTITNYLVTPVVGVMPWPYPLRLQAQEVSRAFTIPLEWLADPANHEERQRPPPPPYPPASVIYFKQYDGELLWGVSAKFTLALLEALEIGASLSDHPDNKKKT